MRKYCIQAAGESKSLIDCGELTWPLRWQNFTEEANSVRATRFHHTIWRKQKNNNLGPSQTERRVDIHVSNTLAPENREGQRNIHNSYPPTLIIRQHGTPHRKPKKLAVYFSDRAGQRFLVTGIHLNDGRRTCKIARFVGRKEQHE